MNHLFIWKYSCAKLSVADLHFSKRCGSLGCWSEALWRVDKVDMGMVSENNLFIFHRMFLFVEIIHNTQNAAFITELYQSTPIWTTPNWNTFKWTAFSILNLRSTNQLNIVGLDAFLKSGSSNCIHTILYGLFRLSICNCGKDYSLDRKALLLRVNVEAKE